MKVIAGNLKHCRQYIIPYLTNRWGWIKFCKKDKFKQSCIYDSSKVVFIIQANYYFNIPKIEERNNKNSKLFLSKELETASFYINNKWLLVDWLTSCLITGCSGVLQAGFLQGVCGHVVVPQPRYSLHPQGSPRPGPLRHHQHGSSILLHQEECWTAPSGGSHHHCWTQGQRGEHKYIQVMQYQT